MTYTFIPEVLDYVAPADTLAQASEKINTNFQAIADGGLLEGQAGETLAQYTVVYANSSDSYKLWLSDANGTIDEADAIAITLDAISDDATGTVQFGSGVVTNALWAWTPKTALFLGLDGAMTHDPSSYSWTKPLGMAISATEVWFAPSLGWSNSLDEYEIASDRLEMEYVPTNYTRTTTPEVSATTQLSAHLKGIDERLAEIIAMIPS